MAARRRKIVQILPFATITMLPRLKDAMWDCEKTVISNSVVYAIFNLDILTNSNNSGDLLR